MTAALLTVVALYVAAGYWCFWLSVGDQLETRPAVVAARALLYLFVGPLLIAGIWVLAGWAGHVERRLHQQAARQVAP